MNENNYDFEPNDIVKTMIQNEVDKRSAEEWAQARVAIANSRVHAAMAVTVMSLFLVGALGMALIQVGVVQQSPTQINIKQPN